MDAKYDNLASLIFLANKLDRLHCTWLKENIDFSTIQSELDVVRLMSCTKPGKGREFTSSYAELLKEKNARLDEINDVITQITDKRNEIFDADKKNQKK